jgi:hypothetical protein
LPEPSPQDQLSRLMSGYWYTQAVSVAARLGLADLVKDGPRSAEQLAADTRTDARSLYRLLRALASLGIFAEDAEHRFALTPLAECLRSDVPGSLRPLAIVRGDFQYEAWGQLLWSVQTGRSGFEKLHGMPLFDYLSQHPDKGRLFDDAMTGVHGRETTAMLDTYDFARIDTLADIGSGNGEVLLSILRKYPSMCGIHFDLPAVAERARANIAKTGLADRCRVVAGNFFESVPAADAYLMRHIIHDWDDEKAATILRHCRQALGQGGKVLVVEGIVPPGNEPAVSKFFDLAMMVLPGGMERTEDEYRLLFDSAGLRLARIVPTASWISVLECEPA